MPARNPDLHGMVPDSAPVALILLDVINDLEFDHALEQMRRFLKADARPSPEIDVVELLALARR